MVWRYDDSESGDPQKAPAVNWQVRHLRDRLAFAVSFIDRRRYEQAEDGELEDAVEWDNVKRYLLDVSDPTRTSHRASARKGSGYRLALIEVDRFLKNCERQMKAEGHGKTADAEAHD